MVHNLFYRSHPFERQLSLHFRIVSKVFFKLIIRISDSQRPSPASEWQLTIWLILFYHVFRAVSTFFCVFVNGQCPACLFLLLLIFLRRLKVEWHTILNYGNLCATNFSFFSPQGAQDSACLAHKSRIYHFVCQSYPLPGRETAPSWHTNPDFTALCAKVSRCPAERQRRAGTQTSNKPICVPPLTFARMRDSADEKRL